MYPLLDLTMLLEGWREGVSARGTDGINSERFHLRAGPSARSDETYWRSRVTLRENLFGCRP
jgi:hypothetical protein